MEIEIKLTSSDTQLAAQILDSSAPAVKDKKILDDGTVITLQRFSRARSINLLPETITLVVSIGTSVAANVLSSWLYDKIKKGTTKLYIEGKETAIEEEKIRKIIEETFHKYN